MTTGNFTDWTGNMLDIGPIYPFVGSEGLLVILAVIFWIGWHIWQHRVERENYEATLRTIKQGENMDKALRGAPIEPHL